MKTWKIIDIWINRSYWFCNWWYIVFKIWKIEHYWGSRRWLIEDLCISLWIYKESEMNKLKNKRFEIIKEEKFDNWDTMYEIQLINKKINPEKKKFYIYSEK